MKRQLLNKIIFILLLLPVHLLAQPSLTAERDITGLWKGSLYNDTTQKDLPYEIAISEEKGKLIGYSYTLFDIDGKKEWGVKRIKINRKDDQVIIEDVILISNDYSEPPPRKVKQQSVVNLLVNDTAMQLTGKWSTNQTKEYRPLTGSLKLQRTLNYRLLVLYEKLVELKLDKDLSFVKPGVKTEPDIAKIENPTTEIKLPLTISSLSGDADGPKEIAAPVTKEKTEIMAENKPVNKEIKQSGELVAKPAAEKPKEIAGAVAEKKTALVVENKPDNKESKQSGELVVKPAADKPKEIAGVVAEKKTALVVENKPDNKESKQSGELVAKPATEKPKEIAGAVSEKKTALVVENKPDNKVNKEPETLVVKPAIDKPEEIDGSVSEKKRGVAIIAQVIEKMEIKPSAKSIAKVPAIHKPKEILSSVAVYKATDLVIKDSVAIKNKPFNELVKKPEDKPKTIIAPVTEKKKEIVVAINESKKLNNQPALDKPKTIIPPPVIKKTEPVAVFKLPAKTENKPSAEIVQKPVTNEKPKAIATPEINNKTVPVIAIKEPVKTESRTTAPVLIPPEKKKELPVEIAAPIVSAAAANVSERKMKNEHSVFFESDSLVLTLYDNGVVDGDTVSVLMNGQIIFSKVGLTTQPNSKTIYIEKGMADSISMVMYAENLGSIPPNTGLMIIMDGEKRYEVRFTADLQTNAAILFRRKPKEK